MMVNMFAAMTANDAFVEVNRRVLAHGTKDVVPRGRPTTELTNLSFVLIDPRARVVSVPDRNISRRKLFGRLVWELCGRMDLGSVAYYDDQALRFAGKDGVISTAYGARLKRQMPDLIELLTNDPSTRRAVGLILGADDSRTTRLEYPCAISTQYMIRRGKLDCVTVMRSQSVWGVLPYDIAMFTLFQEYVAHQLGIGVGTYTHIMTSAHIYGGEVEKAKAMVESKVDNFGECFAMKPFFEGLASVDDLERMEASIRTTGKLSDSDFRLASTTTGGWGDVVLELLGTVDAK